jgi:hypothetical protein
MSGKQRRARLDDIARIAGALREPVETPDFTSSILERVHAEKPFTAPRTRRWMPVVRVSAACVAVLGVFAFTLIVFIKPDLPEKLGAPPSVTTDLVQSAEHGVANKVAGVFESVQLVRRAADPRALLVVRLQNSTPTPEASAIASSSEPQADAVLDLSPPPAVAAPDMIVSFATIPAPLPSPVAVVYPRVPPEPADYAAFTRASFVETRFAVDDRSGGIPWQRAAMVSQPWGGRAAYLPTFAPDTRPRLNSGTPMLLKELFPLITGQPAGDDLQIR